MGVVVDAVMLVAPTCGREIFELVQQILFEATFVLIQHERGRRVRQLGDEQPVLDAGFANRVKYLVGDVDDLALLSRREAELLEPSLHSRPKLEFRFAYFNVSTNRDGAKMRVLVTGGAGFIGSHLVDTLLARGDAVTVLDNLSSGTLNNLKIHMDNPALRFVQGDIRDAGAVERALTDVDAVIHEAAVISVPLSIKDPELAHSVNVEGTLALLKASLKRGVKRFIYASSCAVYGEQAEFPISENAPLKPLSPYASSKLAAEKNCLAFHEREGLETVCLRYFNVYGPRQTGEYAGVMTKFMERLCANKSPIIYGDGEQTRDFVYVSDVVDATLLALERGGAVGEVINIGTGKETNINELCELFLGLAGKTHLKPVHEAWQAGDIKRSQADISKARKLLGFEPKVRLEDGVQRLLESIEGLEKS